MNDMTAIRQPIADAYDLAKYIYLDIETIPTQDAETITSIKAGVKPPASITKPESIAKWYDEKAEDAGHEAVAKTSFDGGRGHVCTISWAINGGTVSTAHAETVAGEADIIRAFFTDIPAFKSSIFVGHNVAGFDIPFLIKRAIILGVPIPRGIPRDAKPWGDKVHDTMTMWTGSSRDFIGMDALCKILGISGKDGMDGSQVAGAWAAGRHREIAEYCAADVERTRKIHQRFLAVDW